MKKILGVISLVMCILFCAHAQTVPTLKFNAQSKFKIVQFTDIHLQYDSYRSDSVLVMMREVIRREKPDLVMLTGDVVGSDNRKNAWLKAAQVMIDAKTPWAAMFGNHDAEFELTKQQTMDAIVGLPYNLTVRGPEEVAGEGNYVLAIQSSRSEKTAALCYVLDVSQTNDPPANAIGEYAWIDPSQTDWYSQQSDKFKKANGGTPVPALAFFHIPFPEFYEVIGARTTIGFQSEREELPSGVRSNLYSAMQRAGDVMGAFVGHLHNNNYIGCLDDICLGFGQTSGRQVYGELGSGARVIELHEGERKFDSWIVKLYDNSRELDLWTPAREASRMFYVSYPASFTPPQNVEGAKINMISQGLPEVSFYLAGSGPVSVDWGDGSPRTTLDLSGQERLALTHSYSGSGSRQIAVTGDNITALDCRGSGLTFLDVSENTELLSLDCGENQLMNLDVSRNIALEVLWCNGNNLVGIELANNKKLKALYCYANRLRTLALGGNPLLERLNCAQNQLKDLDLAGNPALRRIDCYENRLSQLDLSNNKVLNYTVCSDNLLTAAGLNAAFSSAYGPGRGKIFIGGNPGQDDCDRRIATDKGWSISLRY